MSWPAIDRNKAVIDSQAPPLLSEALALTAEMIGEDRARAMCEDAPRALLDGREPVLPAQESDSRPRRSFWGRWFGRGD